MKVDFNLLPDYARVWIYQAGRPFTPEEKRIIEELSGRFLTEWTAHGNELKAGSSIRHDRFLILAVNEKANGVSGCSIDASVHFIRSLEAQLNISLTDRSKIAWMADQEVKLTDLKNLKDEIANERITKDTLIFNNLVQTKGALKNQWLIPAGDSWMSKYFNIKKEKEA